MENLTLKNHENFVYLSFGKVIIDDRTNELFEINSYGKRKPLQDGIYALKSKGTIEVRNNKLVNVN